MPSLAWACSSAPATRSDCAGACRVFDRRRAHLVAPTARRGPLDPTRRRRAPLDEDGARWIGHALGGAATAATCYDAHVGRSARCRVRHRQSTPHPRVDVNAAARVSAGRSEPGAGTSTWSNRMSFCPLHAIARSHDGDSDPDTAHSTSRSWDRKGSRAARPACHFGPDVDHGAADGRSGATGTTTAFVRSAFGGRSASRVPAVGGSAHGSRRREHRQWCG